MIATIVGRGHGGTRAGAAWLKAAGFDTGQTNDSMDRKPFGPIYRAAKIAMACLPHVGDNRWDYDHLATCPIPDEWHECWRSYLAGVCPGDTERVAWKLPETVFSMPWLARTHPDIRYILWHRDPRDAILAKHGTDDLTKWGVEGFRAPGTHASVGELEERAWSWVVQFHLLELVKPPNWMRIRLRDFTFDQAAVGRQLAPFLGLETMPSTSTRHEAVGRWRTRQAEFGRAREVIAPYIRFFGPELLSNWD